MWHAKTSGAYAATSDEAHENWQEFAAVWVTELGGTLESCAGVLGNMGAESGWNPWRWEGDNLNNWDGRKGYGLPQFTPATGYLQDYGPGVKDFNPYCPPLGMRGDPMDGAAQVRVICGDLAGKYIYKTNCPYLDLSPTRTMAMFMTVTDVWLATVAWLWNYEEPAAEYRTEEAARGRNAMSEICYNWLKENGFKGGGIIPGLDANQGWGAVREIIRRIILKR